VFDEVTTAWSELVGLDIVAQIVDDTPSAGARP
jgi:hypothetical protein